MEASQDLRSLLPEELSTEIAPLSLPAFRTRQLFQWLQQKGAAAYDEMSNLPKDLRTKLISWPLSSCRIQEQLADSAGNRKYLFALPDGACIESVVMQYRYGRSICISTQVGCRMGCGFCASGMNGKQRDLLPGEMLSQLFSAERDLGAPIAHVVLMGIGEPLDNYENTLKFLKLLSHPDGRALSLRRVSLSTCGLVPELERLREEHLGLTLSVSLHAPDDALRQQLMPVGRRFPIQELLAACWRYGESTSRRISFEYALFQELNDSPAQAQALARLLLPKKSLCHINLIPANPLPERRFQRSRPERIRAFQEILVEAGLQATLRRSLGCELRAACGQLRQSSQTANHKPEDPPVTQTLQVAEQTNKRR